MQAIIRQKAAQIAVIALKSTTYKQNTTNTQLARFSRFQRILPHYGRFWG